MGFVGSLSPRINFQQYAGFVWKVFTANGVPATRSPDPWWNKSCILVPQSNIIFLSRGNCRVRDKFYPRSFPIVGHQNGSNCSKWVELFWFAFWMYEAHVNIGEQTRNVCFLLLSSFKLWWSPYFGPQQNHKNCSTEASMWSAKCGQNEQTVPNQSLH